MNSADAVNARCPLLVTPSHTMTNATHQPKVLKSTKENYKVSPTLSELDEWLNREEALV